MHPKAAKFFSWVGTAVLFRPISDPARTTVAARSGAAAPNAQVPVKNGATGQSTGPQTNSTGLDRVLNEALALADIDADPEVQFAGQAVPYKQVPFQGVTQANEARISGTAPATLSNFQIGSPSFVTAPVKNEIPVHVEMTWRPR